MECVLPEFYLESILRYRVQAQELLVGVLDQQVLAIILLHAQVYQRPHDAPAVVHVQVDLLCKVLWLHHLHQLTCQAQLECMQLDEYMLRGRLGRVMICSISTCQEQPLHMRAHSSLAGLLAGVMTWPQDMDDQ